jgi:hypothetical protein
MLQGKEHWPKSLLETDMNDRVDAAPKEDLSEPVTIGV